MNELDRHGQGERAGPGGGQCDEVRASCVAGLCGTGVGVVVWCVGGAWSLKCSMQPAFATTSDYS